MIEPSIPTKCTGDASSMPAACCVIASIGGFSEKKRISNPCSNEVGEPITAHGPSRYSRRRNIVHLNGHWLVRCTCGLIGWRGKRKVQSSAA